ncbi:MAG: archaeal heat shock protein Hsp14 [Candidatus Nitrosocaldaceae archaeon]
MKSIIMILRYIIKELMREISNRSREFFEFVMPPIDIAEDGNDLVILMDLAGFKKEDITVRISDNILNIRAKRELDYLNKYIQQRPLRIEKSIPLPITIKRDEELKATYKDGVLEIRIPISGVSSIKIE